MTRGRRSAVTLLAVSLVALAGCSGGSGGGSGDGQAVEVGHLTVTVPEGWTEEPASGEWDKKFVKDGVELQVSGTFSEDPTASAAYSRLDLPASVQLPDYEGKGARKAEVEGADTAVQADFTYTKDGTPMSGVWVIAGQYPYPSTAALALSGEKLDPELVRSLVEGLSFTKTQSSPTSSPSA